MTLIDKLLQRCGYHRAGRFEFAGDSWPLAKPAFGRMSSGEARAVRAVCLSEALWPGAASLARRELRDVWHLGSDGHIRDVASGEAITRHSPPPPMRPGDLLPRAPLAPSGQNDDQPAEHDGLTHYGGRLRPGSPPLNFPTREALEREYDQVFKPLGALDDLIADGVPLQAAAHPIGESVAEDADVDPLALEWGEIEIEAPDVYTWWSVEHLINRANRQHARMNFGPGVGLFGTPGR